MKTTANLRRQRTPLGPRLTAKAAATLSAFDPALPEDGALIIAGVLRDQFNGLNAEILERVTQAAFDAAVTALEAEIAQRTTQAQVNEAVYQGIDTAVATVLPQTSANSNAVSPFDEAAYGSYDQAQIQRLIDRLNELVTALRR